MTPADVQARLRLALKQARGQHPQWPDDLTYAAAIVAEEAGELVKAVNDYKEDRATPADMVTEAIHTAVTAIRFLEGR